MWPNKQFGYMLLKYCQLVLAILVFPLLTSCENNKDESEIISESPYPVGKEYKVSLNITPFLQVEEQPLSRTTSDLPNGLYAVNVFWRGKSMNSYQPYASGLFDDPYRVEIGLIEGYTYRFDCSFIGNEDISYCKIQNDTLLFGLPFSRSAQKRVDGYVTNDLLVSLNAMNTNQSFHQHIYKGEMQMKVDSVSTHPTIKRYYGSQQLDFLNSETSISISIELKRAYYSVQFVTDELNPGDSIKIEANDVSPLYLLHSANGQSQTEARIISMYEISDYYTGRLRDDENIQFSISYRPANEEIWHSIYANQTIKMKRNKKNIVKIVKIDEHLSDATLSFGEDTEMEEAEQELGK